MANPLSDRGVSDRDYAAAVGTLVGEAGVGAGLKDYQAIADVIANRLDDKAFVGQYGKNIAAQTMNPKEFSAWSAREKHANLNAKLGFMAAIDPVAIERMPKAVQERVELAKQAVNDVFVSGVARGITQGATFYDNPEVTAQLGTGGFHNRLDRAYGSAIIGDHRFTGPNFRADQPFDPITYNGQLDAPMPAEAFFGDVGLPTGSVEFAGALPDLSQNFAGVPASPNFSDVFSTGGLQPSDYSIPDSLYSGVMDGGAFAPTDAETLFSGDMMGPPQGFSAPPAAMSQDTFNDVFSAGFPAEAPKGFATGFGDNPYGGTPDFGAPSLDARNAIDRFEGQMEVRTNPDLDMTNEAISSRVMAELSPQAPALAAQPFSAPPSTPPAPSAQPIQAPAPSSAPSMTGFSIGDVAPPSTRSSLPSVGPAVDLPAAPSIAETNYSDLVGSTFGAGKPLGGFMDAMANPSLAAGYGLAPQSPGLVGWGDKGLTIGGFASPVDAIASLFGGGQGGGYQGSGMAGDTYRNSRGFVDPGGWSLGNLGSGLADAFTSGSAYGQTGGWLGGFFGPGGFLDSTFGTGWDGRGSGTGDTGFGGGTRGDGSYSDHSGYNDNNPQGIL